MKKRKVLDLHYDIRQSFNKYPAASAYAYASYASASASASYASASYASASYASASASFASAYAYASASASASYASASYASASYASASYAEFKRQWKPENMTEGFNIAFTLARRIMKDESLYSQLP